MEFEDSRNALFPEPNAYILGTNKKEKPTKIVFQEPYERLPTYYVNNDFHKGDCDCVSKPNKRDCNCNHNEKSFNKHNDNYHNNSKQNNFGFNFQNLLPLMGMLNKGGGADLSKILGILNNSNNRESKGSNPMNLISGLLSNKDMMSGILNLFNGGFGFNKKQAIKKELKSTDFEIKNYTKV